MGKPSRHNLDTSSEPGSAPSLSKQASGGSSAKKRHSRPASRRNSSPMTFLIGGASLLLGFLIVVAILQQRAMSPSASVVAQAESSPSAPVPLLVDTLVTTPESNDVEDQARTEETPATNDLMVRDTLPLSPESSEQAVTTLAANDAATPDVATSEESMTEEEPDEVTPEEANPTAEDFEKRIVTAAKFIREQKGKEAIITLKQASGAYPKEIRADFYLGLIYSGVGLNEPKNAEIHFKRVLDREAGHVPTLNNLGLIAVNAHKYPAARNYFTQARKDESHPTEVEQNLGRMLNRAKILEIKNDQLKMIAALKPDETAYQKGVGWLYMPFDRTEKSLQEYKSFSKTSGLEDRSCCYCQGKTTVTCRTCAGRKTAVKTGVVNETRNLGYGNQHSSTPVNALVACSGCSGRGRVDCQACSGGVDPELGGGSSVGGGKRRK